MYSGAKFLYFEGAKEPSNLASKKPTYDQLIAQNMRYRDKLLKLQEEIDLLRKSFLPEDSYYKDRFYRITENVNDVVYRLILPEFRYEYVSPQSKELFGYEPEYLPRGFTCVAEDRLTSFYQYYDDLYSVPQRIKSGTKPQPKEEVLLLGWGMPMPLPVRSRRYDLVFWDDLLGKSGTRRSVEQNLKDLGF